MLELFLTGIHPREGIFENTTWNGKRGTAQCESFHSQLALTLGFQARRPHGSVNRVDAALFVAHAAAREGLYNPRVPQDL
jgi:hypothetical protein